MHAHLRVLGLLLATALLSGCPSKGGDDDDGTPSCVPETDAQFCSGLAKTCEPVTALDNCAVSRTADCGACSGTDACVSNVCRAPACANLSFAAGLIMNEQSTAGEQDAVIGTTPDGGVILRQFRTGCGGNFSTFVADRLGVVYQETDLTALGALSTMAMPVEGTTGLSPDGLSIIATNTARTGFLVSTRTALGLSDFSTAAAGPYAAIVATGTQLLGQPVLSPDALAFYYVVSGDGVVSVNGIYESVRASTSDPFVAGTRMPAPVQDFGYVTAVSSDRMALFVEAGFAMSVLTRTSLLQAFVNPNAPAAAPSVPGLRSRPLADCSALVGTCTVSGCLGEEICSFPAVPAFAAPRPFPATASTAGCPATPAGRGLTR